MNELIGRVVRNVMTGEIGEITATPNNPMIPRIFVEVRYAREYRLEPFLVLEFLEPEPVEVRWLYGRIPRKLMREIIEKGVSQHDHNA